MIYFTYKTTHQNGKFYVGRHSTECLDDGYFGSGTWVRSVKDKSKLSRQILEFFNSEQELKDAERKLIDSVIGTEKCMNFNNNSVGFGSEDFNPGKRPEERKRRSERLISEHESGKHVWRNTPNFSETEEGKKFHKERNKDLTKKGLHNFQREESKAKVIARNRENADNGINPMFNPDVVKKVSDNLKNKAKRYQVALLKPLDRKTKKLLGLGLGWYQRPDEWLDEKLAQLNKLQNC